MTVRTLSHDEAREVYDRIGSRQDTQAFYEDRATGLVVRHGDFAEAGRVFEFGSGTGRFARLLFDEHLSAAATYLGVDVSPTMVELARARLAQFEGRAEVRLTDGAPDSNELAGSCDRFVSNYVLDLLSEPDIEAVLEEAHRLLVPGGLLCLASLSTGSGAVSRAFSSVWSRIHALAPRKVGGCRPIDLLDYLSPTDWETREHARVTPFGVCSEVVIAARR